MTRRLLVSILSLFTASMFFVPAPAHAQSIGEQYDDIMSQGIIFAGICTSLEADCDCRDYGQCTLNDIMQVVVNVSVLILGLSGTIVLVMFIWGGFVWLTAAGNPAKVKQGLDIMTWAVVGLIIVFASYAIVATLVSVLKTGEVPESGETIEDIIGGNADEVIETSTE